MFSDYLQKIDRVSNRALLGVAAGLIILCQLIAMAVVVGGQVKKAHARNSLYASERIALAHCIESSTGVARNICIAQAQASIPPSRDIDNSLGAQAVASVSAMDSITLPALQTQGFMPASLGAR